MSCSTLLTNNTTANLVAANGIVPLGSAVHGYGKGIVLSGNSIQITQNGYYDFFANLSVSVTGTDTITVQLYKNGVAVNGALASATPSAAAGLVNLSIPWIIRKCGCACIEDTYTIVLSAGGTVNDITVKVERI